MGISATISEGCFGSLQEGGDGVEYFHMLDMTLEQGRQIFLKTLTGIISQRNRLGRITPT